MCLTSIPDVSRAHTQAPANYGCSVSQNLSQSLSNMGDGSGNHPIANAIPALVGALSTCLEPPTRAFSTAAEDGFTPAAAVLLLGASRGGDDVR